jgi:hypothetical protein
MQALHGTSIALWIAGAIVTGAAMPAGAADMVVKAPAAVQVVECSNLNWSHGWLDHGGWGGWGYQDGLVINGWPGNCSSLVGVGPYAYAPRESGQDRDRKR